jgi:formylglycine-generating enzyme
VTSTLLKTSLCAALMMSCTTSKEPGSDSGFVDADASTSPCRPGDERIASCGRCGTRSEVCGDEGLWTASSEECFGELECVPGTSEDRVLDRCAVERRECSATCGWGPWELVVERGACEPGDTSLEPSSCGFTLNRCTAECDWEAVRECSDGCGDTRRTEPATAEEVCIPAGDFERGTTEFADTLPVTRVSLSAYYIDRYLVSNSRYMECWRAGVCPAIDIDDGTLDYLERPENADIPAHHITFEGARAFCMWDGRRLPTEAEWERAARGPEPTGFRFPWGNELPDCRLLEHESCDRPSFPPPSLFFEYPVYAHPQYASIDGVENLMFSLYQWVEDTYAANSYRNHPGPDPLNTSGDVRQVRGLRHSKILEPGVTTTMLRRFPTTVLNSTDLFLTGIRCARSVEP